MTVAALTDRKGIVSETRAPKIILVHRSRPKLSLPSQWTAEGPEKRLAMSLWARPCGASNGAQTAAEKGAEAQADHADDGQEGVAQPMADDEARAAQALGIGGAHEILAQPLDHGGAHQPADDRRRIGAERQRRQQDVGDAIAEHVGMSAQGRAERRD